jgi:hypothetical protein
MIFVLEIDRSDIIQTEIMKNMQITWDGKLGKRIFEAMFPV